MHDDLVQKAIGTNAKAQKRLKIRNDSAIDCKIKVDDKIENRENEKKRRKRKTTIPIIMESE